MRSSSPLPFSPGWPRAPSAGQGFPWCGEEGKARPFSSPFPRQEGNPLVRSGRLALGASSVDAVFVVRSGRLALGASSTDAVFVVRSGTLARRSGIKVAIPVVWRMIEV